MRQIYEPGLEYETTPTPIMMWISADLYPTVQHMFEKNYALKFADERWDALSKMHVVELEDDLDEETFMRHLETCVPGGYAALSISHP